MKPFHIITITAFLLIISSIIGCANDNIKPEYTPPDINSNAPSEEIVIHDRPVIHNELREQLIRQYTLKHYGAEILEITPQAVVIHWTASDSADGTFNWFNKEKYYNGTLNVCSHFLVDRDGTVYRLTKETLLCRHIIGYNWCAIGIENVGGVDGTEDLTHEQLLSNIALIRYLHKKYPTINWVFGHYQQTEAQTTGLYKENVSGYYSIKSDPGPKFMESLAKGLKDEDINFLPY